MANDINFQKITRENLQIAIDVQNEIFPLEDGTKNFIDCISKNPYRKELDFYLVYFKDTPIGVTGIYSYNEYPDAAWLGWFGVLSKERNKGYGSIIFDKTEELARQKGYKSLRLYTDDTFLEAHRLYHKKGMIKEIYDNPDDIDSYGPEGVNTYIFSKSLNDEKVSLWDNKILGLKEQGIKEHQNDLQITIEMACSINGFIADLNGNEDFLADRNYQIMLDFLKSYDCLVWGNNTFKNVISWGENYIKDLDNTLVIIFSKNKMISKFSNVIYCDSIKSFYNICYEKNLTKIFVSGGATINNLFLKENIVDNIIINYNPYLLNKGINLFDGEYIERKLSLDKVVQEKDGIIQVWYNVDKG